MPSFTDCINFERQCRQQAATIQSGLHRERLLRAAERWSRLAFETAAFRRKHGRDLPNEPAIVRSRGSSPPLF